MTTLKFWIFYFEVTFYFDVFTKQILTWKLSERRGGRDQYIDGLADVLELLKGHTEPTILHTDQGSVYASMAYNNLIQDTNIIRSMSRAGKPTDNPVNEALNGWIKEELYIDFQLDQCRTRDDVKATLRRYIGFYNKQRPCFAIGYDTPDNYCKRFYQGELEKKDTFSKRVLTEEPKFIQKQRTLKQEKKSAMMILNKKELDRYLMQTHQTITEEKQQKILSYFAEDPGEGNGWSEQDIWEQVRKIIREK
jgi:hypothetical protein